MDKVYFIKLLKGRIILKKKKTMIITKMRKMEIKKNY
jgi:hypothetical protein